MNLLLYLSFPDPLRLLRHFYLRWLSVFLQKHLEPPELPVALRKLRLQGPMYF